MSKPNFSKGHYDWLAREILHCASNALILNWPEAERDGIRALARFIMHSFERDCPRFDRDRFAKAAGLE